MTKQQKDWAAVCETTAETELIDSATKAANEIRRRIEATNGYEFEHTVAVFLNNQNHIVKSVVIGIGGFAGAPIFPEILFKKFFTTKGAARIILGHNHPSGTAIPSAEDRVSTVALKRLARDLGVELLDNLVVTHDTYVSIPTSLV